MKLRRLLCALVVFTLVMTSVVCSVSAATYQTTTVYTVGATAGDLGTTSLKTTVTGLTEDTMVSYIIYDNEGDSDTVADDGANIVYIDQQTAGEDGTLVFGTDAKFTNKELVNKSYKLASSAADQFDYKAPVYVNPVATQNEGLVNSASSVLKLEMGTNVTEQSLGVSFNGSGSGINMDITATGYSMEGTSGVKDVFVDGNPINEYHTFYPGSIVVFDFVPKDGYVLKTLQLNKNANTQNGGDSYAVGKRSYTAKVIGGKMKLDLDNDSNSEIGFFDPGSRIALMPTTGAADTTTAKYIKVDGAPIYETYTDDKDRISVTYLMTKSDSILETDCFGINLYAFPAGEGIAALDDAEIAFTNMKALKVNGNKFGIQLTTAADDDNAKYFDPAQYTLVVVPYYGADEASATELKAFQGSTFDLFYSVDGLTDLSGGTVTGTEVVE